LLCSLTFIKLINSLRRIIFLIQSVRMIQDITLCC
jgi:hypothetical protein